MTDDRMIGSRRRDLACWRSTVVAIFDQEFPLRPRILKIKKIESDQVIEEKAFNLSSKDINLGPKYVQRMTVSSGRPLPWR